MAKPGCGPSLYLPEDLYPEGYDRRINGEPSHKIIIERDLWEDDNEGIVDLLTDPKDYRPNNPAYTRTDQSDRFRYNEYECNLKTKMYEAIHISRVHQYFIDEFTAADKFCAEMVERIDEYLSRPDVDPYVNVGFDTEKDCSTFQTSILLPNFYRPNEHYERHALFQMQTKFKSSSSILKTGVPDGMKRFFSHEKIIIIGKEIRKEGFDMAKVINLDAATTARIKYIECDQIWHFIYNLAFSYNRARRFLNTDHGYHRVAKQYWSCIGNPSLESVCVLAWPDKVLEKRSVHRNQHNNFDQHKGKYGQSMIQYGVDDGVAPRAAVEQLCEGLL